MNSLSKPCTACGETKPLDAFHSDDSTADGCMKVCAKCHKERKEDALLRKTAAPPRPAKPRGRRTDNLPRLSWRWQDAAACKEMGVDKFIGDAGEERPERERREAGAKLVCHGCSVRNDCLDAAIATKAFGVWGGLDDDERASERRRRMRRVNAA